MTGARGLLAMLALCFGAAAIGAWGGAEYVLAHKAAGPPLHEALHHQLHLSGDQQRRIEILEDAYGVERRAIELEMRAANADLAKAYADRHAYTPSMQAAIDRSHRAMAALQKATLLHVTAMRAVLTPDQAQRFDATIIRSLTAETP